MMHSISPCHIFIPAMSAYSFTIHHLASCIPSRLHVSCMVSFKDDLYKLLLVQVMAVPSIHVSAEENLGDPIDIREELTALRFRVDIAEAENASLRARIKTTEAIEKITRNRERQVRIKMEQQLAAVQESQRQDREDFRKLKELVTSQFGQHS
ncbi:hypothetical protein Tco_1442105 [Tanacetum coccineum]